MKSKYVKWYIFVLIVLCVALTPWSASAQQTRIGNITAKETPFPQAVRPDVASIQPKAETSSQATPQQEPAKSDTTDAKATPSGIQQAMTFYMDGDFDRAKEALADACRENPNLPPPGIILTQFAVNMKQEHRVRYWLDVTAREYPDDPEAYLLLADFAINEGRLTEAKTLVEKSISLFGNIASNAERADVLEMLAESVQGRICQQWEDWDAARTHFEKLLAKNAENADMLARLGFISANQEKYDDAISYYQKAITAGAKLPTPKLMISQIADQQGKADIAEKYFNEAMRASDIDPESVRIAVQIQLRRGNIEQAETFLTRAVKVEPDNLENLLLAGTISMFKKDYKSAETQFQKAILITPNSYGAMHGLALALVELDGELNKERALTYAKNNVKNSGESTDSVATLAWIFFKSGKLVEAEYFANYVSNSGDISPLNAYFLAEILAARGQPEKSLILLQVATASKNNFMKKAEAEALQKKLVGTRSKPATE